MWSDEGVGFIEFMERFFRCEAAFAGAVSFADAVATGEDGADISGNAGASADSPARRFFKNSWMAFHSSSVAKNACG